MTNNAFEAALEFIWRNARVIDRQRLLHHFVNPNSEGLVRALLAYQNPDGGFGHALEADCRCPDSQPETTRVALEVLEEAGSLSHPSARQAGVWLFSVARPDGSLPFCLPTVQAYPRAPWWEADGSISQIHTTGAVVGLLTAAGFRHDWLQRAADFCWNWFESTESLNQYEAHSMEVFLRHAGDHDRAIPLEEKAKALLASGQVIPLDPDASAEPDTHTPLHFAPSPDHRWRDAFTDRQIERCLDRLAAEQQDDGGWPIDWPAPGPAAVLEWRGKVTVDALRTLREYRRL